MLSRSVAHALGALQALGRASDRVMTARELARVSGVSGPALSASLRALAEAGIVRSVRGARGGYRLRRPLESLSMREVVEACDGPIEVQRCPLHEMPCDGTSGCQVHEALSRARADVFRALESCKVMDLLLKVDSAREVERLLGGLAGRELRG